MNFEILEVIKLQKEFKFKVEKHTFLCQVLVDNRVSWSMLVVWLLSREKKSTLFMTMCVFLGLKSTSFSGHRSLSSYFWWECYEDLDGPRSLRELGNMLF